MKNIFHIKALRGSKLIVSVSNYTKRKLIEQIFSLEEKILLLPNSVDGKKFTIKPKVADLAKKYSLLESKIILTVARLYDTEKGKGYDKVIRSLPLVMKEISNVKYILVGEGDDKDRIQQLVKDLNLEAQVVMTGFVNDRELLNYYNLCDVFLMPSKREGFGIVFLEALACGKPVVAGNKDASWEPLLNGALGILVDPDNIGEIAGAVIKILQRNTSQNLLTPEYLRRKVLAAYGFDKFKRKVDDLIGKL